MARPRLLVAEDHREMRAIIVRILERDFEIVGTVSDGPALLEAEPRLKPDICVINIAMPVLSGIEAAIRLRRRGSITKIIFLTAHSQAVFLEAALDAGAIGYVLKPRLLSDLHQAICEALAGRQFVSPSSSAAAFGARAGDSS